MIDNVAVTTDQLGNWTRVFEALVVVIGFIGLLANVTVFVAIVTSKQERNRSFIELIVNQTAQDIFSCVWLVVSYSIMFVNIQPFGYWSCMLFVNENLVWIGLNASKVNLMSISIERYVMIVHPIWHRNNAKPWMIHTAVGVSWSMGFAVDDDIIWDDKVRRRKVHYRRLAVGERVSGVSVWSLFICVLLRRRTVFVSILLL